MFFLACRRYFGEAAVMAVASECAPRRRAALRRQYPQALIACQALYTTLLAVQCHVWGISWPCQFYSMAGVLLDDRRVSWRRAAWDNTLLVCRLLAAACAQQGGPPLMIVLENVPGLAVRRDCRPMLRRLCREMWQMPYMWLTQIVCAHEHCGAAMYRRRLFFVGVRRDAIQ